MGNLGFAHRTPCFHMNPLNLKVLVGEGRLCRPKMHRRVVGPTRPSHAFYHCSDLQMTKALGVTSNNPTSFHFASCWAQGVSPRLMPQQVPVSKSPGCELGAEPLPLYSSLHVLGNKAWTPCRPQDHSSP